MSLELWKNLVYKVVNKHVPLHYMRRAIRSTETWSSLLIRPGFFLLLHQKLTSPCFLFLCFLQVNLEFLGHFYLFSLCSSFFHLSALFALQIYPFLLPIFGFISTLAGAGLADNLFELLLHCPPGRAWPSSWASGAAVAAALEKLGGLATPAPPTATEAAGTH